ncbi:protein AGENET DOMAIN (AGD)-CONTAINING P1 isoform X1 [Actinidia eriantha]|uniref:protein AGENET DOMAIN (AGD)-CONTAINING P1 isoform X1 n=2 Tax=Actinidia eriantha TaxID=165200 RepID=UPI0025839FFE|nr:protein AGENET DOMAIN (AGD)-CONTAINING P1 isoform X1 [Actinidia eriantha]
MNVPVHTDRYVNEKSMADPNKYFRKGSEVEISSNDEGFRGAWYAGTVIRPPSARSKKVLVQYRALMADEAGKTPLQETLDVVQLRPPPPREAHPRFEFSQEVDARYNDGWWEGVVMEVLEDGRCSVFFRGTREQLEFEASELRVHREWVNGSWVPPLEVEETVSIVEKMKPSKKMVKDKFSKGTLVEVSSDEDGFQGAWFAATIIDQLTKDKFLIEYKTLRNDDDTDFLREEADILHIRPCPPDTFVVDSFNLHDEVDALYNDGWWVGVISTVLKRKRYLVYFRGTNEEMEFKHSDLRLHKDWIDGKWIMASRALKL